MHLLIFAIFKEIYLAFVQLKRVYKIVSFKIRGSSRED